VITIFELWPFWIGTAATSFAGGYYIKAGLQPVNLPIIPIIFAIAIGGMFVTAFASFSAARKNAFGLFLGLFSLFFFLGTFVTR